MALKYKLEFLQAEDEPADESVYIHLQQEIPAFRKRIGKEDYSDLDDDSKDPFIGGLFLNGITEISSQSFRVWVMKSPAFSWEEVLDPLLDYISDEVGEDGVTALPGSAKKDGKGTRLDSKNNRRSP